jgi:hypothetical protein
VPTETKREILAAFRALLFAKSKAVYDVELTRWNMVIEDIEVKPRSGGSTVLLKSYFVKNWGNTVDMWAMHARNDLPIGSEHTNNRLEQAFRTMKERLRMLNVGDVSTARAVRDLVRWAEKQLLTRYTLAQRKVMQISDPNPELVQLYKEAARELTNPGCMLLKETVEKVSLYETSMEVLEDGGVKQVYKKETKTNVEVSKVFATTESDCSCVWRRRNTSSPCHHTLFLRRTRGLPMFLKSLFGELFYRDLRTRDRNEPAEENNKSTDLVSEGDNSLEDEDVDQVEGGIDFSDFRQKFHIAKTRFNWLLSAICKVGKPEFLKYMGELEQLTVRVRQGLPLIPAGSPELVAPLHSLLPGNGGDEDDEADVPAQEGTGEVGKQRFGLKFAAKLKMRGRPAGSGAGQIQFYITKTKSGQRRVRSKTATRVGSHAVPTQSSPVTTGQPSVSQKRAGRAASASPAKKLRLAQEEGLFDLLDLLSAEDRIDNNVILVPDDDELDETRILDFCYYPPLAQGHLTFTLKDYRMLQPGVWGNDTVVDFSRYLQQNVNTGGRVHVVCRSPIISASKY